MKSEPLPPYLREAVDRFGADGVKEIFGGLLAGIHMAEELRATGRKGKLPSVEGLDKNDIASFFQYLAIAGDPFDFTMGAAVAAGCMLGHPRPLSRKRQAAIEQYFREVLAGAVGRLAKKAKRER